MKLRNFISVFVLFCLSFALAKQAYAQSLVQRVGQSSPSAFPQTLDQPRNHFNGGYMWQKFTPAQLTKGEGGTYKILVILAQYKDVSFFYTQDHFIKMLTADNYTDFGAEASSKAYLEKQVGAAVSIEVSSIVTVNSDRSYYGKNGTTGNDMRPGTFVAEACMAADAEIDFSQYDIDGDGFVDNVFVFFAGEDEAQAHSEHPEYMWSHSYNLKNSDYQKTITLDGVQVNNYACASELFRKYSSATDYDSVMAPIGTFCHEYLHNFGLADLYDTDYAKSGGIAAGVWWKTSLMASGNYNNNGNTPANLNAIELMDLGVMEPEEIKAGDYTLYPLGTDNAQTYALHNPADLNEYYLFEVRALDGWDRFIGIAEDPGIGMLVYHVDKSDANKSTSETFGEISSAERWHKYNEANANPKHQCADLIEADGRSDINPTDASKADISGIFFPGYGATALGGDAKIQLSFWDGTASRFALRNIRIDDGTVKFSVSNLDSPIPVDPDEPPTDDAMLYIIVITNADNSLSLRASNHVGATQQWFFNDTPIADPNLFLPTGPGTIRAELTWPDGSVDYLFKNYGGPKE